MLRVLRIDTALSGQPARNAARRVASRAIAFQLACPVVEIRMKFQRNFQQVRLFESG
jgi:hypothetical protein